MCALQALPLEILARVLRQPESSNIIVALWKCGNKQLNGSLSNGGCDTVVLKDDVPSSTSRWPRLLVELRHLKKLSIDRVEALIGSSEFISEELRKLAPTVEEIRLNFRGGLEALLSSDSPRLGPNSKDAKRLWNITQHFPNLKVLEVETGIYDAHPSPPFSLADILPSLPATLTRLHLTVDETQMKDFRSNKLPSGLKEIKLRHISGTILWPSSLTSILGATANEYDYLEALDRLPRGVREISHNFWPSEKPLTESTWDALPTTLLSLNLNGGIDEASFTGQVWSAALPQHLTHLSFSVSRAPALTWSVIQKLPRTLITLHDVHLNYEEIRLTCTHRKIFDGTHLTGSMPWPEALQTLRLANGGLPTISRASDLQFFPKSLTHLEGLRSGPDRGSLGIVARNTPLDFEKHILAFEELKHLSVSGDRQTAFSSGLPSHLTVLKVHCLVELGALPPASTTPRWIEARSSSAFGSHRSPVVSAPAPPPAPLFAAPLPTSLTELRIDIEDGESALSILERLPQGLKTLHLRIPEKLFQRSTTSLLLLQNAIITRIDSEKMPAGLETLVIDFDLGIPADVCLRLPKKLRSFKCKFTSSMTAEHVSALPTTLRHFLPDFVAPASVSGQVLARWPEKTLSKFGKLRYHPDHQTTIWAEMYRNVMNRNAISPDPRLVEQLSSPQ